MVRLEPWTLQTDNTWNAPAETRLKSIEHRLQTLCSEPAGSTHSSQTPQASWDGVLAPASAINPTWGRGRCTLQKWKSKDPRAAPPQTHRHLGAEVRKVVPLNPYRSLLHYFTAASITVKCQSVPSWLYSWFDRACALLIWSAFSRSVLWNSGHISALVGSVRVSLGQFEFVLKRLAGSRQTETSSKRH